MRRASVIEKESVQIATIKDLTSVFESLASNQVAKVKNKAEMSKQFFELLWQRYSSIRVNPKSRISQRYENDGNGKKAYVIISAEAGLSGDIDDRLIEAVLRDFDRHTTDIIVLGTHGANQLMQRGVPFIKYFQVPESDRYIDVSPVIDVILPYSEIIVYYEEYVSLGVQEIKTIDLMSVIRLMSEGAREDSVFAENTIFEPSLNEIAEEMESTMMTLALSQSILESGLAQAASRFNAMAIAKKHANEMLIDYRLEFHRAKRSESDRRLREVLVGIKNKRRREAARK